MRAQLFLVCRQHGDHPSALLNPFLYKGRRGERGEGKGEERARGEKESERGEMHVYIYINILVLCVCMNVMKREMDNSRETNKEDMVCIGRESGKKERQRRGRTKTREEEEGGGKGQMK